MLKLYRKKYVPAFIKNILAFIVLGSSFSSLCFGDDAVALKWDELKAQAKQGGLLELLQVGAFYYEGKNVPSDPTQILAYYTNLANTGDRAAQFSLGFIYAEGKLVTQDDSQAIFWYTKAAEQGYVNAQLNLALLYHFGKKPDFPKAIDWYSKAANQGELKAQLNLGALFYKGEHIPQDYAQALHWYAKAAQQGDGKAQSYLAFAYYYGLGSERDFKLALEWSRKAADQDIKNAQMLIGFLYANGREVPRSDVVGLAALVAADIKESEGDRERLSKQMTPDAIAAAQALAAEMRKSHNFIKALDAYSTQTLKN